jgi:hypothetical protein
MQRIGYKSVQQFAVPGAIGYAVDWITTPSVVLDSRFCLGYRAPETRCSVRSRQSAKGTNGALILEPGAAELSALLGGAPRFRKCKLDHRPLRKGPVVACPPKMSGGRNLATVTLSCPCAPELVRALRSRRCFVGRQGAALPAAPKDCGGRTRGPYGQSTLSSRYANLEPGANQAYPSLTTASQPGSQPFLPG